MENKGVHCPVSTRRQSSIGSQNNYVTLTIGIKYQIETSILAGYYDDETLEHKHQSIKEKKRKRKKKKVNFIHILRGLD